VDQLSVTGGARIGWVNVSWPLARLSVSNGHLHLNALLIGQYDFAPEEVIALQPYGYIPVLGSGVMVVHRRMDYPRQVIFWSVRPARLIERIGQAGFIPAGTPEPSGPVQIEAGFPVRWQAFAAVVVVWNLLLAPYVFPLVLWPQPPKPGFGLVLAPAALFIFALAMKMSPVLQRLVLKEGRSIGEISPVLNLILFVAGLMTALTPIVILGAAAQK
jgi:hypothetical protein